MSQAWLMIIWCVNFQENGQYSIPCIRQFFVIKVVLDNSLKQLLSYSSYAINNYVKYNHMATST